MDLDYNLNEILEDLDDSLFRLRQITENGNKRQVIDSKYGENGSSTTHKITNTSLQEQKALKETFEMSLSTDIGIYRPFNDSSCMDNYPVSCISDNWETIRCQVLIPRIRRPKNDSSQHNYLSNKISDEISFSNESHVFTNIKVYLEDIK